MRIRALFVVVSVAAVAVLTGGHKMSYSENPNNYNCDEVIEYVNPVQHSSGHLKTREVKSYAYYGSPRDHYPHKHSTKYNPTKYYWPMKREGKFYQVFQPTGERSYEPTSRGSSGPSKSPAIQIYVV